MGAARIIRYLASLLDVTFGTLAEKDVLSRDATSGRWVNRTLANAGIAPLAHTHVIGDVTNLATVLTGKSDVGHTHIIANITGLQSVLNAKVDWEDFGNTLAAGFTTNHFTIIPTFLAEAFRIEDGDEEVVFQVQGGAVAYGRYFRSASLNVSFDQDGMAGNGARITDISGDNVATGTVANARTTATSANTVGAIVARDGTGSFSAGTITPTLIDFGVTGAGHKAYFYHSGTAKYGIGVGSGIQFFAPDSDRMFFGSMALADGTTFVEQFSTAAFAPFVRFKGSGATGAVGTEQSLSLVRDVVGGVSWPQVADFKLGRYSTTGGVVPNTRLDINLKNDASLTLAGDITVLTLSSDGKVTVPISLVTKNIDINNTAGATGGRFFTTNNGVNDYPFLWIGGPNTAVACVFERIISTASFYFGETTDTGGVVFRGTGGLQSNATVASGKANIIFIQNTANNTSSNEVCLRLGPHNGYGSNNAPYVGAYNVVNDGGLTFGTYNSGNLEVARVTPAGIWMIGTATDDTSGSILQVNGNVRAKGQMLQGMQTLTDGATIAWDLNVAGNGTVTLGAAGRAITITNYKAGGNYQLIVKQDATGNRTITTWPANCKWSNGVVPVLSTGANAIDIVTFFSDGTNLYGVLAPAFA